MNKDIFLERKVQRFPLRLALAVQGAVVEHTETQDISACALRFYLDSDVKVGAMLEFTIAMPSALLGAPQDVLVNCTGRVTCCSKEGRRSLVAAVIDEYQFERT